MAIIDSVTSFIEKCPLLERKGKKGGMVNINCLSEKPIHYSIDNVPANPMIKKYTDGGSLRQFIFVFASRESYGIEKFDNKEIAEFYENFSDWIEAQDKEKKYPKLGEGLQSTRLEVLTTGYLFDEGQTEARFQIQCRLIYYKGDR